MYTIIGNIGVSKSALSEITDSTNSARAFSTFGLVFGLGGIGMLFPMNCDLN